MAKKLITTAISDTAQMPIKKGTLKFLQDSHFENVATIIKSMLGYAYDPSKAYILYGLNVTNVSTTYTYTDGAIFYGDTVYQVDGVTITISGGNVAVLNLAITQYTTDADPVTFTDLTVHNVHDIIKLAITASTSGLLLYSDLLRPVLDISTETERAQNVENSIIANVYQLKQSWTTRSNISDVTAITGTASITGSIIRYKINGQTMYLKALINFTATSGFAAFKVLLPSGVNYIGIPTSIADKCVAFDSTTEVTMKAVCNVSDTTIITMQMPNGTTFTDGNVCSAYISMTIEIA